MWKNTGPLGRVKRPGSSVALDAVSPPSGGGREDRTNTLLRETRHHRFDLRRSHMAGLAALCLLLVFPLSSSQSTLQSEKQINGRQAPPAPPPPTHIQDLLRKEETSHLNTKRTYGNGDRDNAKVGLFVAAALGTFTLMASVYCIYNKFYSKHQYLHTQLNDDPDLSTDPMDPPPVYFHTSVNSSAVDVCKAGYGSLSDTPSIISVPPCLSPPPSAMPFPPPFLSSRSLRTISAKDLEKGCI